MSQVPYVLLVACSILNVAFKSNQLRVDMNTEVPRLLKILHAILEIYSQLSKQNIDKRDFSTHNR